MDLIDRTLKRWRQSEFAFGSHDCLLSIGDYVAAAGGPDIASRFRGTYDDEAGAIALLRQYGGFKGFVALAGLTPLLDPAQMVRGDIAIIDTCDKEASVLDRRLAAICTGKGIAARTPKTVMEIERKFVTIDHAWNVSQ